MKYFSKILFAVFALSLILTGCKKDDEKSNSLSAGGEKFTLASGVLIKYGVPSWAQGCYFELILASPEININESGILSGTGKAFRVSFVSSSLVGIESHDYVFDETDDYRFNTFHSVYCLNSVDGIFDPVIEIASGIIKVKNTNGTYEITVDCEDENGDAVTGYYNGAVITTEGMLP